jgi:hypothetical protein
VVSPLVFVDFVAFTAIDIVIIVVDYANLGTVRQNTSPVG